MWGTCTQGNKKCTCYNPNIIGAACDACASGWHNDQCTVPICKNPCFKYGGACTSPDKCTCKAPYYGATCAPVCGDRKVQYPEQCDTGGSPFSCCNSRCSFTGYGVPCGTARGPCENNPICKGFHDRCEQNNYKPRTTECKRAIYECDSPIYCNGFSPQCPPIPDRNKGGQVCYRARTQCEKTVTCGYSGGPCPSNHYQPGGTPCNNFGKQGRCTGYSSDCRTFSLFELFAQEELEEFDEFEEFENLDEEVANE